MMVLPFYSSAAPDAPLARTAWPLLLVSLLASIGATVPGAAQEYCVACTEPSTLYRCVIDGARPGVATSLQLLCITTLAKAGPHATCAVRHDLGVIDCNGPVTHVAVPSVNAEARPGETVPPEGAVGLAPRPAAPPASAPASPNDDPKTVAEMLRRAKAQNDAAWAKTNAQIHSNNEKIGGFFSKSWTCLSSLFTHCGSAASDPR